MSGLRRAALMALACASALVLYGAGRAARAEDVPDHMTLLETLGSQAAGEMLDHLSLPAGATIHLVPETPHPANWLMSRLLEQALVKRGHRVISPAFGKDGSDVKPGAPAAPASPGSRTDGRQTEDGGAGEGQGSLGGEEGSSSGGQDQPSGGDETGTDTGGVSGSETSNPSESGAGTPGDSTGVSGASEPAEAPGEKEEVTPAGNGAEAVPPESGEVEGTFRLMLPVAGEVVSFRIVECGISYPWVRRSLLIGPQRYGRIAAVRVWGSHLQEPGHRVAATARGERIRIDSFPGWARTALEGQSFPFPLKTPESTSLKSVVEPAVVAGIVGGLIYLFYQNQK